MMIKLDNINKLRKFVDDCSRIDADIEVSAGNYFTADAKSIMGLMTLNLMAPLELRVLRPTDRDAEIFNALREYRYEPSNA